MAIQVENVLPCLTCQGTGGHCFGDDWEECFDCDGSGLDFEDAKIVGIQEGWFNPSAPSIITALEGRTQFELEQARKQLWRFFSLNQPTPADKVRAAKALRTMEAYINKEQVA